MDSSETENTSSTEALHDFQKKIVDALSVMGAAWDKIFFKLTDEQATYILDMPLRRLTKMSKLELETEQKELKAIITKLKALLASDDAIKVQVSDELTEVSKNYGTPRRTRLA